MAWQLFYRGLSSGAWFKLGIVFTQESEMNWWQSAEKSSADFLGCACFFRQVAWTHSAQ
jgi:hypothetical protein